jgi:hypothetical protein
MGELLAAVLGNPVGTISKLAPRNREIACWERLTEILMVPLRECSDCDQVGTVTA